VQDNAQRGQQALQHPDPPYWLTMAISAMWFTMPTTDAST
jgi:hypothetical protein